MRDRQRGPRALPVGLHSPVFSNRCKAMRVRSVAICVLWSALASLQTSCAALSSVPPHTRVASSTPAPGPQHQEIPAGGVVAEDGPALQALLADPRGPVDIWLRGHVYHGDYKVTRPVRLHGTGATVLEGTGHSTVLDLEGEGDAVSDLTVRHSGDSYTGESSGIRAKGQGVTITRVTVDRTLFGVSLQLCLHCIVDRVRVIGRPGPAETRGDGIKLWESNDSQVLHCAVENARDVVVWYSKRVTLDGNQVHGCRYGTHFMYAHDAIVRNSHIENNVVGIFVMYSERMTLHDNVLSGARGAAGIGLGFKDSDSLTVRNNWVVGNTTGIYLDRSPRSTATPAVFEGNVIALDGTALRLHSTQEGVTFRRTDFRDNGEQVQVEGGGDALQLRFEGNFWSDYAGYDLDHDGTGDVAFEVKKLTSDLTDQHPQLRWFQTTVAMGLLDTVARALPLLSAEKMLIDQTPTMRPHHETP
jgi:nitrous oxidase accessory protein